jgi:hypothetical protein
MLLRDLLGIFGNGTGKAALSVVGVSVAPPARQSGQPRRRCAPSRRTNALQTHAEAISAGPAGAAEIGPLE